jgi:hypothetical protein
MKVVLNNVTGEMMMTDSSQLHYMENGAVRKFYQVILVSFIPTDPVTDPVYWSIFNWGAHSEAPGNQDLRGQLQSSAHKSRQMAIEQNERQIKVKGRGGYQVMSGRAGHEPVAKILTETGATRWVPSKTPPTPAPTPISAHVSDTALTDLKGEIDRLATSSLAALAKGDIGQAVPARQQLLDLIARMQSLQEMASGQLEILNAKLFADIHT